jgi:hypothetical protein
VEVSKGKRAVGDLLAMALRNASDRTLNLDVGIHPQMRASDPNGRQAEAYTQKLFRLLNLPDDTPTVSLPPGEVILTGHWGKDRVEDWLPPGRWTVKASYNSDRKADKVELWTGQVWSQPFPLRHGPPATIPATSPAGDAKRSP